MKKKLVAGCYLAAAAFYLLTGLLTLGYDTMLYASGKLSTRVLLASDFELYDIATDDAGRLFACGGDPQMLLNVGDVRVRSISYTLKAPANGENALYYTTVKQSDFSKRNIVLAPFGETQKLCYVLPMWARPQRLRLDLGSRAGDVFEFEEITLNARLPLYRYFALTAAQGAWYLFAPLLAACFLAFLAETGRQWKALMTTRRTGEQ